MYTDFYNLREKPFNLTPSPRFLYLGEIHKEALALITYGVMEQKGFVLLTGEVGTGKTTVVQALLENLDSSVKSVYLSNPTLSPQDFYAYVANGVGLGAGFTSKASFLAQFQELLQGFLRDQRKVLLIVDEAQKLSFRLLEEIRLLSNLETAEHKLINIFLVGQPELNQRLSNPRCRPLLQRISIRYHIDPLNPKETGAYIKTRLKIAGAGDTDIFPKGVIRAIHECTQGYPRMINIICDNALLLGYSRGKSHITPAMIQECYHDLQLPSSFLKHEIDSVITGVSAPEGFEKKSHLRAVMLGSLLVLLFAAISFTGLGNRYWENAGRFYGHYFNPPTTSLANSASHPSPMIILPIKRESEGTHLSKDTDKAEGPETRGRLNTPESASIDPSSPGPSESLGDQGLKEKAGFPRLMKRTIAVKPGDTLIELSLEIYGHADERTLRLIQKKNPQIKDINRIEVGQVVTFPRLPWLGTGFRPVYSIHIATFKPIALARSLFERLAAEGHEVYILPFIHAQKGKLFRVTVGAFEDRKAANRFGRKLLETGLVDYAEAIRIDTT